ncbi:MAG: iron ABC transporter [Chloroflexi bacterium HGW-Chloroflexi-9]|nr:MAG: iron ABC transporter [Chloroflexi bacterium HGW-Chloroflexi-9]
MRGHPRVHSPSPPAREGSGMSIRDLGLRVAATARPGATLRARLAFAGIPLAALALVVIVVLASTQGAAAIPPWTATLMLLDRLPLVSIDTGASEAWQRILFEIRLPRVFAAALVGAALATSGSAYQGVFRNPLADPFLLGVASGAALGAAIAIMSPLPIDSWGFGWVPAFAFVGATVAVASVYLVARTGASVDDRSLILAGIALSAMFGGVTSFLLLTGGQRAQPIFEFIFGGFNTSSWERIAFALPYLAVGAVVIALHARALNVMQLDEEQASHLGVDVARTKVIVLVAASLMAATAVAVAGTIGFVGLVVPHAIRIMFGMDYRRTLLASALVGASFMIVVDLFSRIVIAPQEVPVGIVTSMLGGPFFLYLMRRRRAVGL